MPEYVTLTSPGGTEVRTQPGMVDHYLAKGFTVKGDPVAPAAPAADIDSLPDPRSHGNEE